MHWTYLLSFHSRTSSIDMFQGASSHQLGVSFIDHHFHTQNDFLAMEQNIHHDLRCFMNFINQHFLAVVG